MCNWIILFVNNFSNKYFVTTNKNLTYLLLFCKLQHCFHFIQSHTYYWNIFYEFNRWEGSCNPLVIESFFLDTLWAFQLLNRDDTSRVYLVKSYLFSALLICKIWVLSLSVWLISVLFTFLPKSRNSRVLLFTKEA